jgi:hypothetical protein
VQSERAIGRAKKKPPEKGGLFRLKTLVVLRRITQRILEVAHSVVDRTLYLVDFAFGLQLFVAGNFTSRFLDCAFRTLNRRT